MSPNSTIKLLPRDEVYRRIARMPDGAKKTTAARLALNLYGPAPKRQSQEEKKRFESFRFEPWEYIKTFLGWEPWSGSEKLPGQRQILEACVLAVRQQIEKREFESGRLKKEALGFYDPAKTVKNWIRVESGNGTGKTKTISGAVNWFFDCFKSITYTFSSSATQDEVTSWKEIRKDRRGKNLPGVILNTKLYIPDSDDRFAMSRSPSKSGGKGEENTKGQHNEFLLFIIDEADGAEDFIFDAIETMVSGGIYIVLMMANPRSRASRFHRLKKLSYVKTLRISSLSHPNVVEGWEKIPGAVKRDFVEKEIEKGCKIVHVHDEKKCTAKEHKKFHNPKEFTFELPYPVRIKEQILPPGTIFRPSAEFMTRVLGIAPPDALDKTIISVGVYEAACKRVPEGGDASVARVGVDAARSGGDMGTVYIRWQDAVWRAVELAKAKTEEYVAAIATECLKLKEKGVRSLHIRVDAAYGSGVIDGLRIHAELKEAFEDYQIFEVHFGSSAYNQRDYDNVATEMYYETAEALLGLSIIDPPEALEIDLTEREYRYINRSGKTRKILEPKDEFKKRHSDRSPDDGDGLCLAVAPDYCFNQVNIEVVSASAGNQPQVNKASPVEDLARILGLPG